MTVLKREADGTSSPVHSESFDDSERLLSETKRWKDLGYDVHVQWGRVAEDAEILARLEAIGVVTRA